MSARMNVDAARWPRERLRLWLACDAVMIGAALAAATPAWPLAANCREMAFSGAAGFASQDKATIRIVDAKGAKLTESCQLIVKNNENAVAFLRRLVGSWGDGRGGTSADNDSCKTYCTAPADSGKIGMECAGNDTFCDKPGQPGTGVCGPRPKTACGGHVIPFPDGSCNLEVRLTQKSGKCAGGLDAGSSCKSDEDCPLGICPMGTNPRRLQFCAESTNPTATCLKKPAILRVCCFESSNPNADCSGDKLGAITADRVPLSIQSKVVIPDPAPTPIMAIDCVWPVPDFCPRVPPFAQGPSSKPRFVAIDPIGTALSPPKIVATCRNALGSAQSALVRELVSVLGECHEKVMAGLLSSATDCKTVNGGSDPEAAVAAVTSALRTTVTNACEASGNSPTDFGYDVCAPPCDAISIATCSAPPAMVGMPCTRSPDCDSAPAALDGRCGDWDSVADCLACLGDATGRDVITATYGAGPATSGLDPAVQACQNQLGSSVASQLRTELRETLKCQTQFDDFKILLPESTPLCKDADLKARRALATSRAAGEIASACSTTSLTQLDSCSSNLDGVLACATTIAKAANAGVADATAPEGRCGDGIVVPNVVPSDECDDGNLADGDGCDSNCRQTGCGNAIVTVGEECDDGNTVSGDGCASSCTSEPQPCAPQMCAAFTFDCSDVFPGHCVCLAAAEGGGACVNNFNCAGAPNCSMTIDCPPGQTCYLNTCCGGGKCGPPTCTAQ